MHSKRESTFTLCVKKWAPFASLLANSTPYKNSGKYGKAQCAVGQSVRFPVNPCGVVNSLRPYHCRGPEKRARKESPSGAIGRTKVATPRSGENTSISKRGTGRFCCGSGRYYVGPVEVGFFGPVVLSSCGRVAKSYRVVFFFLSLS